MTKLFDTVAIALKRKRLVPATKRIQHANGQVTFVWHVDDNDDRFVSMTDSAKSESVLLITRDCMSVEAKISRDRVYIIDKVVSDLNKLGGGDGRVLKAGASERRS